MSDTEQEPSMEEILASIRSIITDDVEKSSPVETEPTEIESAKTEPVAVKDSGAVADEPLEELEPVPTAKPAYELDDDDEVLDLTDMDAVNPEPLFEQQAYQTAQSEPIPEPSVVSPVVIPSPPNFDNELISPSSATEAIGEFSKLGDKLYEDANELPIGNGAVTLEHLTRELVRPMLKEWLDQHLPMTVERLVREEIERLVMQSQRKDPW
jgi:cell pole-organizing protein PopZ